MELDEKSQNLFFGNEISLLRETLREKLRKLILRKMHLFTRNRMTKSMQRVLTEPKSIILHSFREKNHP